ncbi:unnamed protein product [Staurois parvus]|uniref:Uncharacterized protein n=1 Tax=Staurois parvus TaxID=386267 RepID=A0ABN9CY62_9NEOB|nr:unnamed protein product [Staurois parvus]
MKQFQKNKIKLILSVVKQHEIVSFYAKLHGISIVECIPSEEIDLLFTATGATPVSTELNDHLQNNSFLVQSCQSVLIGDKKYVQLVFSGSLAFKPHSIVLYGPVRGLSEQIASSFHGAFKMLKQLFQPVDASWEQPLNNPDFCLPNRRVSLEEQRVTCSNCQNDSDCCDCRLQRMDQYTHMHCTHSVPGDISEQTLQEPTYSLRTCSQFCTGIHTCLHQLEQSLQEAVEAEPARCLVILKSRSKLPVDVTSHKQVISTNRYTNIGLVLPSGGLFEILLSHHLHNFAKTCQEAELAMICTTFGEALLSIPKHIYKAKKESFPLVYKHCLDALKKKETIDVTQTGLESVSCKYQLMASVLQCITKLVTIDLIIGIKKVPQSVSSEQTNEDICLLTC